MHSAHRDLESKYKRVLTDFSNTGKQLGMVNTKLFERNQECTTLKTIKADQEVKIAADTEEIASLKREMTIKSRQLRDVEERCKRVVDELD